MEFRDLFGDGDASGDLVRQVCFKRASCVSCECENCPSRSVDGDSDCDPLECGGATILAIDSGAVGLPRNEIRAALSAGSDIVLDFSENQAPDESLLREVAILVRRLRTAGVSLSIRGLPNSIRSRVARLEASLGRM